MLSRQLWKSTWQKSPKTRSGLGLALSRYTSVHQLFVMTSVFRTVHYSGITTTDLGILSGQSHLIFGTGSTGCITISQFSKLCCVNAHYKPLEKLDAIALGILWVALGRIRDCGKSHVRTWMPTRSNNSRLVSA